MNQHWTKIKKTECFFAPDISIAYVGYIEKNQKQKKIYGKQNYKTVPLMQQLFCEI